MRLREIKRDQKEISGGIISPGRHEERRELSNLGKRIILIPTAIFFSTHISDSSLNEPVGAIGYPKTPALSRSNRVALFDVPDSQACLRAFIIRTIGPIHLPF